MELSTFLPYMHNSVTAKSKTNAKSTNCTIKPVIMEEDIPWHAISLHALALTH